MKTIKIKKGIYKGEEGEIIYEGIGLNGEPYVQVAFPDNKVRKYSGIISKDEL